MALPEVPYLTRLDPEERFQETIRIPTPVVVNIPYGVMPRTAPLAPGGRARQVVFTLGYVTAGEVSPRPVQGRAGLYEVDYGRASRGQRVLETAPMRVTVEVRN